jgi:hypothetical protein
MASELLFIMIVVLLQPRSDYSNKTPAGVSMGLLYLIQTLFTYAECPTDFNDAIFRICKSFPHCPNIFDL